MKFDLNRWEVRFNEFNIRERLLVVAVLLALAYLLFDAFLMGELYKTQDQYSTEIREWQKQNQEVDHHIVELTRQLRSIKGSSDDLEISELQSQSKDAKSTLENMLVKFIKPKQMVSVLRDVLQQEKGLRLVSMKSIGATELFSMQAISGDGKVNIQQRQVAKLLQFYKDRDKYGLDADFDKSRADLVQQQARENQKKAEIPQIYKHGILLDMVGDYSSTLRYLKKLENLPWKFYWDAVRYEVTDYPKARIRILVNTISLDKEWVHV